MNKKLNLSAVKWCWCATQVQGGYRLKLCIGENKKNDVSLTGVTFATVEDVKRAVKGTILFVEKKTVVSKKSINNK